MMIWVTYLLYICHDFLCLSIWKENMLHQSGTKIYTTKIKYQKLKIEHKIQNRKQTKRKSTTEEKKWSRRKNNKHSILFLFFFNHIHIFFVHARFFVHSFPTKYHIFRVLKYMIFFPCDFIHKYLSDKSKNKFEIQYFASYIVGFVCGCKI